MSIAADVEALETAHRELTEAAHVARQQLEQILSLYNNATDVPDRNRLRTMYQNAKYALRRLSDADIYNGSDEG